jgi:CRISPR/Cas system CMR-associated protein Cmr1 (group 7 of RAMP superfamily)
LNNKKFLKSRENTFSSTNLITKFKKISPFFKFCNFEVLVSSYFFQITQISVFLFKWYMLVCVKELSNSEKGNLLTTKQYLFLKIRRTSFYIFFEFFRFHYHNLNQYNPLIFEVQLVLLHLNEILAV